MFRDLQNLFRDLVGGWDMKKMPANIGLLIDNIGLYREASNFLEQIQLKKFGAALDKMQGDSFHLSDAVHIWYSQMKNNDLAHHRDAIKKMFRAAV